jgi:hypothetical protein
MKILLASQNYRPCLPPYPARVDCERPVRVKDFAP